MELVDKATIGSHRGPPPLLKGNVRFRETISVAKLYSSEFEVANLEDAEAWGAVASNKTTITQLIA